MRTAILLGLCAFSGCSEPASRVTGSVKRNGAPVTAGTVVFFPPNNQTYMAEIQPDGTYAVDGVPRGKVRVAVQLPLPRVPARPDPPKGRDAFAKGLAGADDAAKMSRMPAEPPAPTAGPVADPKFADPNTSGLAFDLTADPQTFDIDLK